MGGLRFRAAQRLRKTPQFQRAFGSGKALRTPILTVFACPNGLALTRMGASVSRKHGGSVRRNRIKRTFREAFRLTQNEIPAGLDLVFVPRRDVEWYSAGVVCEALRALLPRLERLAGGAPAPLEAGEGRRKDGGRGAGRR